MATRHKLVREWAKFAPADKENCTNESTMGGLASYTNLLGCLQAATDARKTFGAPTPSYRIEQ